MFQECIIDEAAILKNINDTDNLIVSAKVILTGSNRLVNNPWYPRFFVERYLYDLFLLMNLSTPGTGDFLNIIFMNNGGEEDERLNLSSYFFEQYLYRSCTKRAIGNCTIPFMEVLEWYKGLGIGIKQKSDKKIEKALFSVLSISKSELSVATVIWIFHALEAIYGTRVGESFTNLIGRISLLLELSEENKKNVKKKLRELYDIRSSFVHGGYQVLHPLINEAIDKKLEDDQWKLICLCQDGIEIIIESLQKMISRGWHELVVTENLYGLPATKKV